MQQIPKIAIVDPNTLAAIGLKGVLQNVMPIMTVDSFGTFAELEMNHTEEYVHFFVAMTIVLDNRDFFLNYRRRTIVLTTSVESMMDGFHCLCINVPEKQLIRSLLSLQQSAHAHGRNLPPMPKVLQQKVLSDREIEVMNLIVQGFINKEIAEQLNIALSTVVTHRRNIMEKLGVKSVSALTIYAVTHGYVDISKI
ncbi:MAG: response regulator transcription factor [Prevotella sp.]|nr:response regulator transcription factor [Prevotella sp.]